MTPRISSGSPASPLPAIAVRQSSARGIPSNMSSQPSQPPPTGCEDRDASSAHAVPRTNARNQPVATRVSPCRSRSVQGCFIICLRLVVGSLELRHVELHHCHHGFHYSLHLPGVPITDQLGESSRDNLPG